MKAPIFINAILIVSAIVGLVVGVYTIATTPLLGAFAFSAAALMAVVLIYLRKSEPYEFQVLTNSIVLDLSDSTGKTAYYIKTSRLRILCDRVFYYVEDMSTDGHLDSFEVTPGAVESVKSEEGKVLTTTTFGQLKNKGEEFDRTFKCRFNNSFGNEREYWVERQIYPTYEFTVTIIFPQDRPYKEFKAVRKVGTYKKHCVQPKETILNGRPALVWNVKHPRLKDNYRVDWAW